MSRGPLRRAIVFVDYSAFRDTLRKNSWLAPHRNPHVAIDFEKLGKKVAGADREFIRTILYTATPVKVDERPEGFFMHNLPVHEHEAYRARQVLRAFEELVQAVNHKNQFTHLECGRMVLKRVQLKHGPAFEWVQQVLQELGDGEMEEATAELFEEAVELNSKAKGSRDELARRIVEIKGEGKIPNQHMSAFTWRLSELMDEQLDFTEKGVDTRLTVQMLEHCMNDSFDDAILFAADEDYVPLVEAVKRTGRRVIHAFWDIPGAGYQLQRVCDQSILLGAKDFKDFS